MDHGHIPILVANVAAHSGCSACQVDGQVPVCRVSRGGDCHAPVLAGPADELRRLVRALSQALDFPEQSPELGGVRGLRVEPGEVELKLDFEPGCGGGSELADRAFQTLRTLLPDTDIYVLPAAG